MPASVPRISVARRNACSRSAVLGVGSIAAAKCVGISVGGFVPSPPPASGAVSRAAIRAVAVGGYSLREHFVLGFLADSKMCSANLSAFAGER